MIAKYILFVIATFKCASAISLPVLNDPAYSNLTTLDGTDLFISCRATGDPSPDTRWVRRKSLDSGEERLSDSSSSRYIFHQNGLLIAPVDGTKDEGLYTCIRSNVYGIVNASIYLDVIVKTQILHPPQDVKVILSSTAKFRCAVRYDHSIPVSISWWMNDRLISNDMSSRIQILPDGSLIIEQARNTDVGLYTCRVASTAGNDSKSARLYVIELPHPPTNIKAELSASGAFVNVSWSPAFDGNSPIVRYVVQKKLVTEHNTGGEIIDETSNDVSHGWVVALSNISSSQNYAIVTHLRPASTYQFRVSAVNIVGEGSPSMASVSRVTLPAAPPSAPPIGVVGAARSSTAITLQWQPPSSDAHNGQLLGYTIRYKLAGYADTPWYYANVTNNAQVSYILEDLIVWKNYELQVASFNEMGTGVFSSSIYVRTKEGRPAASPKSVSAEAVDSTVIRISWMSPDPQLINGINQGYKVRAIANNEVAREITTAPHIYPGEPESYFLNKLEPYTEYLITVACYTSAGDGPPNDPPIRVTTKQDLPGEVTDFKFWNVFDTSVEIGWKPPKKINGKLMGYTLQYYSVGSTADQWKLRVFNFSAATQQTKMVDLKAQTSYTFDIHAWTEIGAGPPKNFSLRTSIPPVLPKPPTHLAISNIGSFSVVLQFTPGFNGNATITNWIVEAEELGSNNWTMIYESKNQSQSDFILVQNLKPYTKYRLRLIPVNVVGKSTETSEPSPSFETLQSPPSSPPLNVTLRPMNLTSLKVRWTPAPADSWNGQARGYNITWKELYENGTNGNLKWHLSNNVSRFYLINGLEEYTNYAVQIYAFNDVGTSNGSRQIVMRTADVIAGELDEDFTTHKITLIDALASDSHSLISTPLPFYFENWFVTTIACSMIIFIILFTAGLCIYNTHYKYRQELKKIRSQESEFELEDGMENPYASGFDLGHSISSNYRNTNGALNHAVTMAATKPPPRPAPGSW
ncbi:sidekick-like protein [Leptotrombidium deliense]|uniref:Sidekick-like protein n=1 Tax=Leptotrombidium deliense TaxID=299467 RepID=A0A443SCC5_9ACAR|nr:sidekick-like protein [Leptotrombidium deliense]